MKFTVDIVNNLLGVEDSSEAPYALWNILFDKNKREKVFKSFLELDHDLSIDWFQDYFQDVQADRKKDKQDFTPNAVTDIAMKIAGKGNYYEVAAGTGGMLIRKWDKDRKANWFY